MTHEKNGRFKRPFSHSPEKARQSCSLPGLFERSGADRGCEGLVAGSVNLGLALAGAAGSSA
jgi:hypothetical protein